jgi:intergrase/recombinase
MDLTNNLQKHMVKPKIHNPQELLKYLDKVASGHFNMAIRVYLNFLVDIEGFDETNAVRYKKVINGKGSDPDLFVPTNEIVRNTFGKVEEKRFKTVFKILTFSGIRISEVVEFLTNYDETKLMESKDFIKYPLNFILGQKRSYYVYLPKSLKDELHKYYINRKVIYDRIANAGLNPKYLRKWFYNFLIYNNVPESVADIMEGRATQTVGSMHYLCRVKQADYWYEKIVKKLEEVL